MKKIILSLLIVCMLTTLNMKSFAQKTVVTETTENLGGTTNPAFTVFIENADYKMVMKAWKTFLEDQKGKVETSKNDVNAANVVFPMLSTSTVAVNSRLIDDKSGVRLTAAFNKDGQYVNAARMSTDAETVKMIVYDFAISVKKKMAQDKLDVASKELDKLQERNKDLVNKKASLEKDLQSYNEKIKQAEADIQENLQQQSESKIKLENQIRVVEELKTKLGSID